MQTLSNLLKDNKISYPIYDLRLPFEEYINQCRKLVKKNRIDLTSDNAEKIIAANTPFELRPDNPNGKGVLLVHGLLDSPFLMRDMGEQLRQQGYLVRAILLPGHGTVPGDLLNVTFEDWLQAVEYGIHSFGSEVKQIYAGGFSTGATLILYHALKSAPLSGMFLLSPAIKIRSAFAFTTNWHQLISWANESAKWLHIYTENDYAKYQSIPYNAAWQVYQLTKLIKKLSIHHKAICPLFFILSLADSTVSAHAAIEYFKKYFSDKNYLLLYAKSKEHQNDANTILRSSVYPELNIHEFSHIALPTSPANPHYGMYGDYVNASRVKDDNQIIYGAYNQFESKIFDYLYSKEFIKLKRKRLSFNPDFEFMMQKIIKFIE